MSKEAEKLAEQLRDMVPRYRTPSHERGVLNDAIQTIRRQAEQIRELREALRSAGLFLHHCWCDVQMNDYSFERLNEQMKLVDAALSNTKEE